MIELVTTEADERAKSEAAKVSAATETEWTRRKRALIKQVLTDLEDGLGHFAQTCHGSMYFHGARIEDVANAISRAWKDPSAFNISELSQCIRGFLKATGLSERDAALLAEIRRSAEADRAKWDAMGLGPVRPEPEDE